MIARFKSYGYKEKKIEIRTISIGTMLNLITAAMYKAKRTDIEIRIVDVWNGTAETYENLEKLITSEWNYEYVVNVIEMTGMTTHNDKEYLKVVISDNEVSIWNISK